MPMQPPPLRKTPIGICVALFIPAFILGTGRVFAQDDGDPAQTEYIASPILGGLGAGGGGLGGISDVLSRRGSGALVNAFTGQVAFSLGLGSIEAQNGLSFPVGLAYYGGGMDALAETHPQYAPGGWVGAGFNLRAPFIRVKGGDYSFANQTYSLSLDGVSEQELIPDGTSGDFVPKNSPYAKVRRVGGDFRLITMEGRCPGQVNALYPSVSPYISYWLLDLPDGTQYVFGDGSGDCDGDESELCQPVVGTLFKYNPFYNLVSNGKSALTFYATTIRDRQRQSALWFRYDKAQDTVSGSCNAIDTLPKFNTVLDRAIYLKEIYATRGIGKNDAQTSRIAFTTALKTEEPLFPQVQENPAAFYENRKLTGVRLFEQGQETGSLEFKYLKQAGRMALQSIEAHNPALPFPRNLLSLEYAPGTLRIASMRDAQDRRVEFGYGMVESAPINGQGGSGDHQVLETDGDFPPNTHIALARQIGNKFYVETENWSQGCLDSLPELFREYLYEYEFNGTYWALKRKIPAPFIRCPTAMDFYLSPDGKYFVWAHGVSTSITSIDVYDLTSSGPPSLAFSYLYTHTGGKSNQTLIFPYPDWFAIYNTGFKKDLTFISKDLAGNWNAACPSAILPSTYTIPSPNPGRLNNYSGENEGLDSGSCLTFSDSLQVYPGPNFLVAVNDGKEILHLFARNDANGIKDYVRGLEESTPALPKFTAAQVNDNDLNILERPWFRHKVGTIGYDNNWDRNIRTVAVSENLIAVVSETGKGQWQYLYVLGWDGNRLRYLYDEPLAAALAGDDIREPVDIAAGPDYFIVKNQYEPGGRKGLYYYKVDLKAWRVVPPSQGGFPPATALPNALFNASNEDWAVKAYPDQIFIERMGNKQVDSAFSPAYITQGQNSGTTDVGGIFYKSLIQSYVFQLDSNRNPFDISSHFRNLDPAFSSMATNFAAQGDRILSVESYDNPNNASPNPILSTRYLLWKRNPDPNAAAPYAKHILPDPTPLTAVDAYRSSRLVTGGVMTTRFTKTATASSLTGIEFHPDVFDLAPKAGDPGQKVHTARVVTSIAVKTQGANSTGNHVQTVLLSYPETSPDGAGEGPILKNFQSGTPNFKYARMDFPEGAAVSAFIRDALEDKVPENDNALIGSVKGSWTLPDKVSYQKPGGATGEALAVTAPVSGKPARVRAVQPLQEAGKTYFHRAYRSSLANRTDFDSKNGQPKISIAKVDGKFILTYVQFQHDLDTAFAGPFTLVRQQSTFQFDADPCARTGNDPCGNLSASWFTPARMPQITSSTILTYDSLHRPKAVYQWRPDVLGAVYPPLNGDPASTGAGWKWVKVQENTRWQDHTVARCKSDRVTESHSMGVFTTAFIGGADCQGLGVVSNSSLSTSALLTGEEDILGANCPGGGPCFGAFGRWEAGGNAVLQSQVVHTGRKAVQVTGWYGPGINLRLRESAGFLDRKKGFKVSAWILATPGSNPAFALELRPGAGGPPVQTVDAVAEYIAEKGAFPTDRWVKVERLLSYAELTANGLFASTPSSDFLRVWIGKGDSVSSAHPVYVDDVRLYPADAVFSTQNADATGLVTSSLDFENEPTFLEYDVWRNPVGARAKDGRVSAAAAVKLLSE